MNMEKQNELMRKGLCFKCKEFGHLSQDCLGNTKATTSAPPKILVRNEMPKKMGVKELYKHI